MLKILVGDKPTDKIFPSLIETGLMYYLTTKFVENIVPRRSDDPDDDAVCPGT